MCIYVTTITAVFILEQYMNFLVFRERQILTYRRTYRLYQCFELYVFYMIILTTKLYVYMRSMRQILFHRIAFESGHQCDRIELRLIHAVFTLVLNFSQYHI